jgi:putative ABC transport system substrate-binding protein
VLSISPTDSRRWPEAAVEGAEALTSAVRARKKFALTYWLTQSCYGQAPGAGAYFLPSFEAAAGSLKVAPVTVPVRSEAEIENVISMLGQEPGAGLVVESDGFMFAHRAKVISEVTKHKLPAVSDQTLPAEEGGLLSYGPVDDEMFLGAALYIDRILRGAKPSELPVQVPTRFEIRLNLKVAEALGLSVPASILTRAEKIIE